MNSSAIILHLEKYRLKYSELLFLIKKIEFLEKNVIKGDVINVSISYNYIIIISNNK